MNALQRIAHFIGYSKRNHFLQSIHNIDRLNKHDSHITALREIYDDDTQLLWSTMISLFIKKYPSIISRYSF